MISSDMISGEKETSDPLNPDDVVFIKGTQRSKRESKSEGREQAEKTSGISDEFCSLFHP